jgi:uncharacterized protein
MPPCTTDLDLAALRLTPGEGRRLQLDCSIEPIALAGEPYRPSPQMIPISLEISRMVGHGYALRLLFTVALQGPCMRCLTQAAPQVEVQSREVDRPGGGEELQSPYIQKEILDLTAWVRDALVLCLPAQMLCRSDCAGLCPQCAADLNQTGPEHHHETPVDSRWAKLRELDL